MEAGANYQVYSVCRSCGSDEVTTILDLGEIPLADALLYEHELGEDQQTVPLTLRYCNNCKLVHIAEEVDPVVLFRHGYTYYSSVNPGLVKHFGESARRRIEELGLHSGSFVVEAACNDGVMLQVFQDAGIRGLGIDPADGPVQEARKKGLDVIEDFFSKEVAEGIVGSYGKADLFLANNVLAHVNDLHGFVEGVSILLKPTGTAVIEVPYVKDTVEKTEFDVIFHQHLCYFSLTALVRVFDLHNLYVNRVEHVPVHGGTLRLFVNGYEEVDSSVRDMLKEERALGLNTLAYYQQYAGQVQRLTEKLLALLGELKANNKTIAGYGAAGKANTLTNYMGIGKNYLDYIADISKYKQGRYFTGNKLPIVAPERILEDRPDYVLILAWNFADEIMEQLRPYQQMGGQFIIPIPEPHIVKA